MEGRRGHGFPEVHPWKTGPWRFSAARRGRERRVFVSSALHGAETGLPPPFYDETRVIGIEARAQARRKPFWGGAGRNDGANEGAVR